MHQSSAGALLQDLDAFLGAGTDVVHLGDALQAASGDALQAASGELSFIWETVNTCGPRKDCKEYEGQYAGEKPAETP